MNISLASPNLFNEEKPAKFIVNSPADCPHSNLLLNPFSCFLSSS